VTAHDTTPTKWSHKTAPGEFARTWALDAEPDSMGFHALWCHPDTDDAFFFGLVSNPENFLTAVDNAEEEMRYLIEAAKAEFGFGGDES